MLKIALGTDHAGFHLKEQVKRHLESKGIVVEDFGCHNDESCDYPDYIRPAAECVANGDCDLGIVFGGSGNGEAIVANKVKGIRCGVCWDLTSATLAKKHNNANMISVGSRMVSQQMALDIIDAWLDAEFEGGRHSRRIKKIED